MRNNLFLHSLFFILFLVIGFSVNATTQGMAIMPPIIGPSDPMMIPIFGQDHAYTVTLRGNGEAVIDMRVALSNFEERPKSEVTLQYSGSSIAPMDVVAFQIIKEKQCLSYDKSMIQYETQGYDATDPKCVQYQEPNYYDYWGINQKYYKATISVQDDQIHITLPKPIEPEKSGSYVLFMRSRGLTDQVFGGAYKYHFETMRTDSPIRNLQIGLLSDSDMKFKGADAQVYYGSVSNSSMMVEMASKRSSFQSTDFDNYVSQIGQGQIYKSSTNLAPGDTYVVDGMYARSIMSLYLKEAVSILGIIVLTFVVIIGIVIAVAKILLRRPQDPQKPASYVKALILVLSAGFFSGLCIGGYTLILVALSRYLEQWYGFTNMLSVLFLAMFSCTVYAILILGPTVFAWVKRGWKWGILMFGVTMLWVVMFLVIIGAYYFASGFFNDNPYINQPVSSYDAPPIPVIREVITSPVPSLESLEKQVELVK